MKPSSVLQRFLPAGALGISLLLHLVMFLGISGVILIQAVVPKVPFVAGDQPQTAMDEVPAPPDIPEEPQPEMPAAEAVATQEPVPQLNLDQITSPLPAAMPAFTVAAPAAPPAVQPDKPAADRAAKPAREFAGVRVMANPFGNLSAETDPSALTGHLYDFKQSSGRAATNMNTVDYRKIVARYLTAGNWDDGQLRKYYRVPQALAAYQIFIPTMDADKAPAAFNAKIEPRMWLIVYTGEFVAPASGTYRFCGRADDIIVARLGDNNVFDGSLFPIISPWPGTPEEIKAFKDPRPRAPFGCAGDWFELKAGQKYPFRVCIGEQPGGGFSAILLIQKKGQEHEAMIFQMTRAKPPDLAKWPQIAKKPFAGRGAGEE
ncbi:MAG: hypothetical protein LBK76_00630 [Verrucomicrobiales bacterium]|nr:hypothetical protein [Verrucomicrobiales bacterium]